MKKKTFVLTFAAMFMLFAIASCDGKKNKEDKYADDNEEVVDEDDEDDEDGGEKENFLTIDEATEVDPVIKDFITDMYENQRYYDEDFLKAHCTERMLQYLKEQYEYDGEGYACWLFRTSSQDGKPGYNGDRDKVTSITKDNAGWYHYEFTDGGWRGENKIQAYVEDGHVMIDQLDRVYDEAYEAYNL